MQKMHEDTQPRVYCKSTSSVRTPGGGKTTNSGEKVEGREEPKMKKNFSFDRSIEVICDSSNNSPEDIAKGVMKATVVMTIPVIKISFTIHPDVELPKEIKLE